MPTAIETPTTENESSDRERRVRRLTGFLLGGALIAVVAIAVPAVASNRIEPAEGAGTTITTPAPTSSESTTSTVPESTTTTVPAPTPEEVLAAKIAAMTPEEKLAFIQFTATPEEKAAFTKFVSPPPPPPAPKPAPKAAAAPASSGGGGGPANGFLACVRNRESHGQYGINTGNGYYGAYQFSQSTWNNTAAHAGRSDLIGVRPSSASPADQDAMAAALYAWQGRAPWAGPGC